MPTRRQIAHACRKLDDLKARLSVEGSRAGAGGAGRGRALAAPRRGLWRGLRGSALSCLPRSPNAGRCSATTPSVVERVKSPEMFFAELARLGIPHPRTVSDPAAAGCGWLAKRQGGAGGSHIVTSHDVRLQRRSGDDARPHLFSGADRGPPGLGPVRRQWEPRSACSASASSGRRRPHARNGAMAARRGPPSYRRIWRRV